MHRKTTKQKTLQSDLDWPGCVLHCPTLGALTCDGVNLSGKKKKNLLTAHKPREIASKCKANCVCLDKQAARVYGAGENSNTSKLERDRGGPSLPTLAEPGMKTDPRIKNGSHGPLASDARLKIEIMIEFMNEIPLHKLSTHSFLSST